MGIVILPDVESYFQTDMADCKLIKDNMKLHRFKELERFFHMCDNSKEPAENAADYNPLFKIQPLLDLINKKSPLFFKAEAKLAVAEAMFAFKRRSLMKQYMPAKPHK